MKLTDFPICNKNPFENNDKFTEDSFNTLMDFKDGSFRLLHYFAYRSRINKLRFQSSVVKDEFEIYFDIEDAIKETGRSRTSIYLAISDLLGNNIIARTNKEYIYFINPKFLLHGSNRRLSR